jgi:type I restriction enzyme S subunit
MDREYLESCKFYFNDDNVPAGWCVVPLETIATKITDGTHKTPAYQATGVRFISIKNIRPFQLVNWNSYEKYISESEHRELVRRCHPERDDILFPRIGTLGYAKLIDFDEVVSIFVGLGLIKLQHDVVLPKFVEFYMNTPYISRLSAEKANGTGRMTLPLEETRRFPFPLPPLREQHRIVARIEELFSELEKAIESLTLARAQLKAFRQVLLKAAFEGKLTADWRAANADKLEPPGTLLARIRAERDQWYRTEHRDWESRCKDWEAAGRIGPRPTRPEPHAIASPLREEETAALPRLPEGWTYTRLSEIAYVSSGVAVSKSRQYEDPVEVPYLRVANVQRGHLDLSHIKSMNVEKSQLPSLALRPLDVLFNEGGDRDKLGRGWVWDGAINPCVTQNHVFRSTLFGASEAGAKLLSHWGNTVGQDYFEKGGKQTTNLASINKTVLKALPVPVITPREAEALFSRIEASLSELDATETEIDTGLAKVDALRQSILQRAFSGRLVPQDATDEPAAALLARLREQAPAPRNRRRKTA